ncbi:MAG TPA: LecA/PA-IL family lectin [Rhizomicrobium sp.]|jgi:hypothetical protein|nr:LecA/PA-IL family lectin [Rhizomicrobium sp.]
MNYRVVAGLACAALVSAGVGVGAANAKTKAKAQYYITAVPATSESGVDTGVSFNAGQTVTVKAAGYISVTSTQPEPLKPQAEGSEGYFPPDGALGANGSATDPDCQLGQLIGMIAGTGVWHCLGKSASFVADGTGDLLLAVNDWPGNYSDNLGDFEVVTLAP